MMCPLCRGFRYTEVSAIKRCPLYDVSAIERCPLYDVSAMQRFPLYRGVRY